MAVTQEEAVVVLITSPPEHSLRIARSLLEERLAACVNIVGGVRSLYWWRGSIEESREDLLVVKTSRRLLPKLEEYVKRIHPYEVPEVIALPITWGSKEYVEWLLSEARGRSGG